MKSTLYIAVAGLAVAVLSGPAGAETILDALSKAYQNNPSIKADRARLRATDEGVSQAISNWRPTVSVNGDAGINRTNSTASRAPKSADVTNPRGGSLTVTQNIYRGGRTQAETLQAESLVQADRARLWATEQTVLLDAATAYINVVRDQAVVELNDSNERVLQRQLEATNDRFRVGEVTRTDVAQAESRRSRARADRIAAQGNLEQSRAAYLNVVGAPPGDLDPAQPLDNLPANEEEAISAARKNNFNVQQSRFLERAATDNVDLVRGELLPQVTVEGELSRRDEAANSFSESESASILARVRVPLYQSGSVSSRVRAAKQVVAQRRNELAQAVRDASEQATSAWEALLTARAQIVALESEVRSAQIALEGVQQEALVGSRTVLDVLDAEQELLNARVDLVGAQRDEVAASYQLRAAIGELTAGGLGLPVQVYDVEKHYKAVRTKWWGTKSPE